MGAGNAKNIFAFTIFFVLGTLSFMLSQVNRKHMMKAMRINWARYRQLHGINVTFEQRLDIALDNAKRDKKIIIYWHPDNDTTRWKEYLTGHPCGTCQITSDKTKINETNTAAIIFLYKYATPDIMPPESIRRPDQLYVWLNGESPSTLFIRKNMSLLYEDTRKFNATMTYRRDSDIYIPYSSGIANLLGANITKIVKEKTRLALAAMTNCKYVPGAVARLEYIKQLNVTGFKIDTIGRCFNNTKIPRRNNDEYLQYLKNYKFYFAFENSYHCRDYVTEKVFFNGFRAGTVPVVWGAKRKDYEAISPPNSFIFVEDFASMEDLIRYLNYLDKNDEEYMKYFRWRTLKPEELQNLLQLRGYCQLCRIVHGINVDDVYKPNFNPVSHPRPLLSDTITKRTVYSLSNWFYGSENEKCFTQNFTINEQGLIVAL